MKPMLAGRQPKWLSLEQLCDDEKYVAEQKIDGKRMIIEVNDREPVCYNRLGEQVHLQANIAANFDHPVFKEKWIFDGEFLENIFYIFDVVYSIPAGIIYDTPYKIRHKFLEELMKKWIPTNICIVPSSFKSSNKIFVDECKKINAEGVIFKKLDGKYFPSKRTLDTIKYKFVETVDAVVMELNRENKYQAITLGLYDDGTLVDVGGCKIPLNVIDSIHLNQVVEIRYLYGTNNYKLCQPVFLRIRDGEKNPKECTVDQLKIVNKDLVY